MSNREIRLEENIAPEVLELASRYYVEQENHYSNAELIAAATEAGIPQEFIEQAIQDIQAKQRQVSKRRRLRLKIGGAVLAVFGIWNVFTYNSLSSAVLKTEAAWAQVENQLQRRSDLIPNLVSVTQAYAKQEQALISQLVESRQAYLQAVTPEAKTAAMLEVNRAIESFGDYATTNPQLQSSQVFANLQYELAGTENRLAVERMRYNQRVQEYNQKIQGFPNFPVAKAFGFEQQAFFQADTADVFSAPRK